MPEQIWVQRHKMIVRFAVIQAFGVGLFGLVRGASLIVCSIDVALVAAPALLALYSGASRRTRTISATVSLMFASATIVDLANGSDVAHFHFFVMVGVVALYQDWTAFGVCILITVLHHAVLGTIEPSVVYGTSSERRDPIVWAFIHGGLLLAAAATHLVAWRANEKQELSDTLTRLPNRVAFVEQLERSLADPGLTVSVLFIDLDNFKNINDSAGHEAGDMALRHMGDRLTDLVRDGDSVARLGGDEFAVSVHGNAAAASMLASRLLQALQEPIVVRGRELVVRASIGVADSVLARSRHAEDLLRDADLAMYLAKSAGGNRMVTYTSGVDKAVRQRADLCADIRQALVRDELEIEYQPVVSGTAGQLVAVEALLRWHHPTRGLIGPAEFVPVAEETGAIREIGAWVLRTAATQTVAWQRSLAGCENLGLAVNLSPLQLRAGTLVELVSETLGSTGLEADRLTLEITESMLLQDIDIVRRQLEELRSRGVRVAIDDFGTGYSSLSYLSTLPVDAIKIDRSFIRGLESRSGSSVLVQAVIEMAHALHLDVVAEGVENWQQQSALKGLGCPHSQGYLFSRALPVSLFTAFAESWPRRALEIFDKPPRLAPVG